MEKGNIVKNTKFDRHGIVLAVRKDGTRAKVYQYGPDTETWVPVQWFEVVTSDLDTCYKCLGTGLYYYGGAVVNGVYTGQTGICFACEGKGKQTNEDRVRCHHYWHRQREIDIAVEAVERGEEYTPLSVPWSAPDPVVAELHNDPVPF